jgi:ribonuclease J
LQLLIHKGSQEIGGTCIQLSQDATTILLDLGLPLKEGSRPVDISALKPDAVFVSHPHQDHYGLIVGMDPSIPIFTSELSKRLIDAPRIFRNLPALTNDFHYFRPRVPLDFGPFKVTPYLVDHSSPDAFAFLIEAGGRRLFYTGDIRAHGRKGVLFEQLIDDPPPDIDMLVMEGTMLERTSDDFRNESAVENRLVDVISSQRNITFVVCSSQNIDRIVSVFRACKKTEKTLVVDVYSAWVLEQMKLVSDRVPNILWNEVIVIVPNSQYQVVKANPEFFGEFQDQIFEPQHRIRKNEIMASPADYVQAIRQTGARFITDYLADEPVNVVYSQWPGYLEEGEVLSGAAELKRLSRDPRCNFVYAHTTGHALLEDLIRLAGTLKPKMLVPVHTDFPKEFKNHFENVVLLEDGHEYEILDGRIMIVQ